MNYYSIDEIEAESEKVSVLAQETIPGIGFLKSDGAPDIVEGTKLRLPLWLAEPLATATISSDSNKTFMSIDAPESFRQEVLNALKTDACEADLSAQSPVFTTLALRWLRTFESRELADVVFEMTPARTAMIFNLAATNQRPPLKLDEHERQLFRTVAHTTRDLKRWFAQ